MAQFYSNENFPLATVRFLREMGHDVLTTKDMGKDGSSIPDTEVLAFAKSLKRCLLTSDTDFLKLHKTLQDHYGIIYCTSDTDFRRLANHIQEKALAHPVLDGKLLKVYRGG